MTEIKADNQSQTMNCIFFYGLFMDVNLLKDLRINPVVIGRAELPDYQIQIDDRATLAPRPGSTAYGIVMDLTKQEAAALYSTPGVRDYRPETVDTILINNRSVQQAICYNLPPGNKKAITNVEYAKKLSALVLKLGFSAAYAREINDSAHLQTQ